MKKNGFCIVVIFCLLGLMSCNADMDEVVNQSGMVTVLKSSLCWEKLLKLKMAY